MIALSSMEVDIAPLLAGAGVVGLAVGFGAPKLVSDIFSGFFFLMDDAFRDKMLENEELGPNFIEPLKSQGVQEVGDSVMTFRVKFKAMPGNRWRHSL